MLLSPPGRAVPASPGPGKGALCTPPPGSPRSPPRTDPRCRAEGRGWLPGRGGLGARYPPQLARPSASSQGLNPGGAKPYPASGAPPAASPLGGCPPTPAPICPWGIFSSGTNRSKFQAPKTGATGDTRTGQTPNLIFFPFPPIFCCPRPPRSLPSAASQPSAPPLRRDAAPWGRPEAPAPNRMNPKALVGTGTGTASGARAGWVPRRCPQRDASTVLPFRIFFPPLPIGSVALTDTVAA